MKLRDEIQALVDAGDWLGLVGYYVHLIPGAPTFDWRPVLAIVWLLLLWLTLRMVWRRFHVKRWPWQLGSVTVDLRGGSDTIHAVVAGMSGTGKSTAVLPLLRGNQRALVVAFDNSRPIRELFEAEGWTIWTPGGPLGWDILKGSPQVVSEALTAGFARTDSDTGYNRGLARMRLWRTLDAMDAAGHQCDLWALIEALRTKAGDSDEDRACRSWANRFESIARSLGTSLGTDLDLAEAMRAGDKVLILPNRFLSPEDAPLVGAIALVQARRVAQEVGDFLLLVEEAGQAGARQVEMNALAQAGRDRGCPLVVITQNAAKLPEEVVNNVKIWVSFAQESKRELAFAAEHLRVESEELQQERMPTGVAWVRAPGVKPKRVRIKRQEPRVRPLREMVPTEVPRGGSYRMRPVELDGWVRGQAALPGPRVEVRQVPRWVGRDAVRLRAFEYMRRSENPALMWHPDRGFWWGEPCLVWTGSARGGRPAFKIAGKTVTTYIETFRWAGGVIPESFTVDHLCSAAACCEPDHLEAVTLVENIRRRSLRKRAMESFDPALVA